MKLKKPIALSSPEPFGRVNCQGDNGGGGEALEGKIYHHVSDRSKKVVR